MTRRRATGGRGENCVHAFPVWAGARFEHAGACSKGRLKKRLAARTYSTIAPQWSRSPTKGEEKLNKMKIEQKNAAKMSNNEMLGLSEVQLDTIDQSVVNFIHPPNDKNIL